MENILLIYLMDQTAEYAHWIYIHESGEKTASQTACLLADCPKPEIKTKTILLFPGEEIFLTTVSLPPTKKSQQAAAALYALEEKLAEDVLDLHAVVFNQQTFGLYSVGIIRKALLESWLQKCEAAHIKPDLLLPDIFAVPYQPDHWTALYFNHRVLIRADLSQGFAVSETHYDLLLNKQVHPEIVTLKTDSLDIFLNQLEENFQNLLSYNLLQGKYRQKTEIYELKKTWTLPVILCASWLVLLVGLTSTKYIMLTSESSNLDKQITALYSEVYPEATAVISPQFRIGREIKQLKGTEQDQSSLELIAKAGNILKALPQTKIESLNFREDELKINLQTKDFKVLEQIVNNFKKADLEVKQSDAARSGENVSATLSIKTIGKGE